MKPPKITDTDLALQERVWIMCSGKKQFEFAEADRRAAELGFALYQCPYCDSWHLTSRAKRISND